MTYHQLQSDAKYLQTHHQELIQVAKQARSVQQSQTRKPNLKDRIFLALGGKLISWGQKLKDATVFDGFTEECCA